MKPTSRVAERLIISVEDKQGSITTGKDGMGLTPA
jgi:hypothetical protein